MIPKRFCGPPSSANGGYTCGILAAYRDGVTMEVTLRAPPPLDTPLTVERDGEGARLVDNTTLVAEARPGRIDDDDEGPVCFEDAAAAVADFPAKEDHPYPTCFVCGTERNMGDGLRIHPGPIPGRRIVAAAFVPPADLAGEDMRLDTPFVWATLDCPSWYGYLAYAEDRPPILLGRLTARVVSRPSPEERCVVVGWPLSREGRKIFTGSALYREDGALAAHARATWIVLRDA